MQAPSHDSWQGRQAETALSSPEIPLKWVRLDARLCNEYASARPVKISGSPIFTRGAVCAFEDIYNDMPAHTLTVRLGRQGQSLKSGFDTAGVSITFEARCTQDHLYIGICHNSARINLSMQAYPQTSTFSKQAVPELSPYPLVVQKHPTDFWRPQPHREAV